MEGKDSDYDVRFVYSRPIEEYIRVNKRPETIQRAYDRKGKPHPQEGSFLDLQGMDIIKYAW